MCPGTCQVAGAATGGGLGAARRCRRVRGWALCGRGEVQDCPRDRGVFGFCSERSRKLLPSAEVRGAMLRLRPVLGLAATSAVASYARDSSEGPGRGL